jgi:predicted secreted protein
MSSSALESQGMLLKLSDMASPEVFTAINELFDISGPDGSANEIDLSDLNSTAKTFRMGLKDSGTVTLGFNYIPANTQHAALRTAWTARTVRNFQMIFTDSPNTTWSFAAYVQNLSISNSVDSKTEGSITLRITGDVTES